MYKNNRFCLYKKITSLAVSIIIFNGIYGAPAFGQETLTVYTYDSITTEWGAGPKLVAGFEKQCGCKLKIKGLEDGAAILTRVRLEQKNPIADVVLGLDGGLSAEATDSGLFIPHGISLKNLNALPRAWDNPLFLPYDYGWLAFVYRKDKLTHPPGSLKDLISSKQKSPTLIIQDPRVSTPGLGLLLWIKQIYGKDAGQAWSALAKRTVTVTPGWSEAYALFIKGEADMVLSYTTSPAYHRLAEQDDRYGAVLFEEGNYFQTELAAILKSSPKQKLAKQFLEYLVSEEGQAILPETQWMFPVKHIPMPKDFASGALPKKSLYLEVSPAEKKQIIREWQTYMRK